MNKEELLALLRDKNAQLNADKRFYDLSLVGQNSWGDIVLHHHWVLCDIILNHLGNHLKILELGSFNGFSTCYFLTNQYVSNIISVDRDGLDTLKQNLKSVNKSHNIIVGDTHDKSTLESVKKLSSSVDFLFIDAGHGFNDVQKDFRDYHDLVRAGGVIAFDDYNDWRFCPAVKPAVDALKNAGEFEQYDIVGDDVHFYGTGTGGDKSNLYFLLKRSC